MSLILKVVSYKGIPPEREISASFDTQGGSVGRSPGNRLILPDPERCISRNHAEIKYENGHFVYADASAAGTYSLDQDRVLRHESIVLKDGDRLRIGEYEVAASIPVVSESPSPDFFAQEFMQAGIGARSEKPFEETPFQPEAPGFDLFSPAPSESAPLPGLDFFARPAASPLPTKSDEEYPFAQNRGGFDGFAFPSPQEPPKPAQPSFLGQPDAPAFQGSFALPDIQSREPESPEQEFSNFSLDDFFKDGDEARLPAPAFPEEEDSFDLLGHLSPEDAGLMGVAPEARGEALARAGEDTAAPLPETPPFPDFLSPQQPSATVSPPPFEPPLPEFAARSLAGQEGIPEAKPRESIGPKTEPAVAIPKPRGHAPSPKVSAETPARPPLEATRSVPAPAMPKDGRMAAPIDEMALFRAFLDGARLEEARYPAAREDLPAAMKKAGALFREMVDGMMIALRARSKVKNEFRVGVTVLRPQNNNPLKFSVTPEDAIKILLARQHPGFIDPLEAVKEGFDDLMYHQMAITAGIQASLTETLKRFDPQEFEKHVEGGLVFGKKNKCWEAYCQAYPNLVNDALENIFGDEFAEVYERQIRKLRARQEP
jgi:type VI secretion system FHA domain protein